MDLQLMKIFAGANGVACGNFDSLMIPFRCLVSDIDSSRATVLRKGDLASSIRGSMSIPFIFNPVEINKRLVFDGGIYDNFPTDAAVREFRPDIIIGSRVAIRYDKPDKDDVMSQLLTMIMERQNDTMVNPGSIMIVPDIRPMQLLDFGHVQELIDSGYSASISQMNRIKKMVTDRITMAEMVQKRAAFRIREPRLLFDSVHISGVTKYQAEHFTRVIKNNKALIGYEELERSWRQIIANGFIKMIYPQTVFNPRTGFYDLYFDIIPAANFSAGFGGNFSLATTSETFLEIKYQYLRKNAAKIYMNGYIGKVYNSASICGKLDLNSGFPWFLRYSYTYNAFNYFRNSSFFFDDKNPGYILEKEYFGKLSTGIPVVWNSRLSLEGQYFYTNKKYFQDNQFTRNDTADVTTFDGFSNHLVYEFNTLNRKQFPGSGTRLLLKAYYVNGIESVIPGSTAINKNLVSEGRQWFGFKFLFDHYFQRWGPLTFGFYTEGVVSGMPLFSNYLLSVLYAPVFQPVPESQTMFLPPFHATEYLSAGVKSIVRINRKSECRLEGYLFQPYREILQKPDDLTAYYGPVFSDLSFLGSAAVVYHSPVGPISVTGNYYDKMPDPFTINFTIGYIIFNDRAMP